MGRGRAGIALEEAVDEADDLGQVGAAHGGADLGGEFAEGGDFQRVGGIVAPDGGGEVLVAKMEHGEADLLDLLGDMGADLRAAEGDASAAGAEDLVRVAVQVEAEELAVLRVVAEDGADGVMGADGFEIEPHAGDEAPVDLGSVAKLGDVTFSLGEDVEELLFERDSGARRRGLRRAGGTRPA